MNTPLKNSAIALVVHVLILAVMLYGLKWGIYAVIFSNILFALLMCILNACSIRRYLDYRQEYRKTFILPLLSALVMGAAAWAVSTGLDRILPEGRLWLALQVGAAVVAAVAVYGVFLIRLKAVDEVELYGMPGGRKLVRLARRCRIL